MNSQSNMFTSIITLLLLVACIAEAKKIAIIGAGFSGVSAAYHLSKKGYDDITIYEAANRPGGYISQVKYNNVTQDIATYAITPIYWKLRDATVETWNQQWCIFEADMAIYDEDNPDGNAQIQDSIEFFIQQGLLTLPPDTSVAEYMIRLLVQITNYTRAWADLMGMSPKITEGFKTDRLFTTKPERAKRDILARPTLDWMNENGFELIVPFMRLVTDTQAYGAIETTPLLYYMTWVPPIFLWNMRKVEVPCGPDTGMQQITDDLLKSLSGSTIVRYVKRVTSVERGSGTDKPKITFSNGVESTEYDQIVVTPKLARSPFRTNIVTPLTDEENRAQETHLELEIFGGAYKAPKTDALDSDRVLIIDGPAMEKGGTERNFYVCVQHEWVDFPLGGYTYNSDPLSTIRTCSLFFYGDRDSKTIVTLTEKEKTNVVLSDLAEWETARWEVLQTRSYSGYFQRWDGDGIVNGYPWTLESVQGQGGIYYVNSAACGFESVGNVFDCADYVSDKIVADSSS